MNILVAIEGSYFSDKALEWAVECAKARDAKLTALTVAEDFDHVEELMPDMAGFVRAVMLDEASRIIGRAKAFAEKQGVALDGVVVSEKTAAEAILEQAKKRMTDLLVLGSRGRKGMNRFVMGSVASRVVRHAPCTTTIVK